MKEKDLMIGDWVLINDAPHKIQAIDSIDAEIQADDELYYVGEDRYHSEDNIEDILITPEILEKNGWKDRENLMELRVNEDIRFLWSKGYGVFTGAFTNQIGRYICNFKYVRTLQHLLRRYGLSYGLNELDELADNFTI